MTPTAPLAGRTRRKVRPGCELKARSAGLDQGGYLIELSEYLARLGCAARHADGAVAAGLIRRELAPSFKGDVRPLLARLRGPDCPGARNVPEEQVLRLAAAAELASARQQQSADAGQPPQP